MRVDPDRGWRLWVALLACLAGCQGPSQVVTARQLREAPPREGERIVLTGQVQELRVRMPERGNSYTEFVIADGTGRVRAFGWGRLEIDSGDLVEVRGVFRPVTAAGSDQLRDVVEVSFVRRLRAARQPPGTPVGPP